mmetsp:Transcript_30341/g.66710  ORF Transcript_30341/g.66710 Transcript_30341/m.66710 type:complete len:140 (-) Transcript_30341:400-819(-)|eukprot:CAMPEP_0178577144 /NCGR_PEP_ID=MMETSP0697-20121206/20845_1 /TAXON_ID=265572 /ORGANISM="Extubocellulus spinifer, Strain CCMP396" /LENGTH=139 /DNA_ID=CAMNT_0020212411 /DNA_START=81 /DNA_END=500 /DNA_ORIENTATION=+
MTRLRVVSALSILPHGCIELGRQDVETLTVGEVKRMVSGRCEYDPNSYRLWWHGYLLDNEDQTMVEACIGVNPGESLRGSEAELALFLTTHAEDDDEGEEADVDTSFSSLGRLRSNSISKLQTEIRKQQETITSKCILM